MPGLWGSDAIADWRRALKSYDDVIARQGVERLPALDRWYRDELPGRIAARKPPHVTLDELVRLTEWKMARGVWRGRNLALVRSNPPARVVETSSAALAKVPHATAPIEGLAALAGVGPATASAVASAAAPGVYPFFDDIAAAQIPHAGTLAYTVSYYARYADSLRERADRLGHGFTPAMVERALWAHAGGKTQARTKQPSR